MFLSRIRHRNKAFSVIFWLFFLPLASLCFTPACPGSLKKKLTVTGDSRKELLSQQFSSVPQPEGCQAERRLLHASAHTEPHAQTCTREVLKSNTLNYTITQSSNGPQQERVYLALLHKKKKKKRQNVAFCSFGLLSRDERPLKLCSILHNALIF